LALRRVADPADEIIRLPALQGDRLRLLDRLAEIEVFATSSDCAIGDVFNGSQLS
jgi:hypothetical protein